MADTYNYEFEERAAILEYYAGFSREEAEFLAGIELQELKQKEDKKCQLKYQKTNCKS